MSTSTWLEDLREERALLGRTSTAGRVADLLRTRITEGRLRPGTRLSEEDLGAALGVSRNTLREAFRLLSHERLLVHEFNRGVFVRLLDTDDVRDLYAVRRVVECGAVRRAAERSGEGIAPREALLAPIRAAVAEGRAAASEQRWHEVGTANMHFHQAMADLAGSRRLSEVMSQVLAELRLVFHVMDAPQQFHAAYLGDNGAILEMLQAGRFAEAEAALMVYLDRAEGQLVAAYA